MRSKEKIRSLALSGVLSALAVVLLLLGSLFQMLDLSMAALASLVVMVALLEMGAKWALGVYAVSAVIAVLLFPQTASIAFAAFLGYYPVLKVWLDKLRPAVLQYLVKLLCFNLFLGVTLFICYRLLGPESEIVSLWKWLLLLGNLTFLVFDFAIVRLSLFYIVRIKPKLSRGGSRK